MDSVYFVDSNSVLTAEGIETSVLVGSSVLTAEGIGTSILTGGSVLMEEGIGFRVYCCPHARLFCACVLAVADSVFLFI